ncbi:hypothetical protein R6Q57_026036 [Mikania cordata]
MSSACLNTIGLSPEHLPERSPNYSSYGWFSPRLSISREEDVSKSKNKMISSSNNLSDLPEVSNVAKDISDLADESDTKEFDGFEFRLEDSVTMLPADELFYDGKLVPLQFSVSRQEVVTSTTKVMSGFGSPDTPYSRRITDDAFAADPYLYSPRAPRCSSRWKELLGFGKVNHSSNNPCKADNKPNNVESSQNVTGATRSIRQLLYRSSKSSNDSPINLPLLKDSDNEYLTVSSRLSLSSSSSGHDIDDLPRLSLDSNKHMKLKLNRRKMRSVKMRTHSTEAIPASMRAGRSTLRRPPETTLTANRGLSVDSPRINSSGKIVFHNLERSSSSPSSFNGGPTLKHRGMERSYSGNVRVLNVPVCSLRSSSKSSGMFGFPMFSQQKREASSGSNNGGSNRSQRFNAG